MCSNVSFYYIKGYFSNYTNKILRLVSTTKGIKLFPFIPSNRQVNIRKIINDHSSYSIILLYNLITFLITFLYSLINAQM